MQTKNTFPERTGKQEPGWNTEGYTPCAYGVDLLARVPLSLTANVNHRSQQWHRDKCTIMGRYIFSLFRHSLFLKATATRFAPSSSAIRQQQCKTLQYRWRVSSVIRWSLVDVAILRICVCDGFFKESLEGGSERLSLVWRGTTKRRTTNRDVDGYVTR